MTLPLLALVLALLLVPMPSPDAARVRAIVLRDESRPAEFSVSGRWVRLGCLALAGALVGAVAVVGGPVLAATAAILVATVLFLGDAVRRGRARRRAEDATVTAIRLVAAELEAGSSPDGALGVAGEVVALQHAVRVAAESGAPLAAVIGGVADDVAARAEQQRAVSAALAGARSSAALLAVLPLLGIGLGSAMGAAPLDVLFGSPAGRALCLVGVLLDALGVLWTYRLVVGASRSG